MSKDRLIPLATVESLIGDEAQLAQPFADIQTEVTESPEIIRTYS